MNDIEKISAGIGTVFREIRNTFALPTQGTLEKTYKWAITLFLCSLVSTLTGFYTFISWQGSLICVALLTGFLFMERRENDALSKMYSNLRVSAEKVVREAKAAGAGRIDGRAAESVSKFKEAFGKRKQSGADDSNQRHDVGSEPGKADSGDTVPTREDEGLPR